MDVTILLQMDEDKLQRFDQELRSLVAEYGHHTVIYDEPGEIPGSRKYTLKDYHEIPEVITGVRLPILLGNVLLGLSPCTITIDRYRTIGFGEDMPQYTHEEGRYDRHY